ncbi:MAG: DUF885 family protein [Kordiimonas sp.]
MKTTLKTVSTIAIALSLAACGQNEEATNTATTSQETSATQTEAVQTENERYYAFVETVFNNAVDRSPFFQAFLGIKKDIDKWDDNSEARALEDHEIDKENLAKLAEINYDALDERAKLSYDLFKQETERSIREFKYRDHTYPINTMFGAHTQMPTFLMNFHRVESVEDAEAFITRLNGMGAQVDQLLVNLQRRQDAGVLPPKFVFPVVIPATRNVITGAPFTDAENDSPLFANFKKKAAGLELSEEETAALVAKAEAALTGTVKPAYEKLIAFLGEQEKSATSDHGVWKFPDGEAFYNTMLKRFTTTDLTADEVHQIGLDNVARIHDEMRGIMKQVGFEGTLQEFFAFMREDEQFYYDNTDEGRDAYLAEATAMIDRMEAKIPEYFGLLPKAPMEVKRVEPFRERSAGKAFYQSPSQDGSRPGRYYANLYDMKQMPKYQMEALAFHEGIPGHHMQRAITQELEGVPMFQKFTGFTAYTEGWGLYTELLGKDMGFYQDPYSDFGRLAMEIWRACRLVVDTGIHSKKWTREQAMQYLTDNTPNPSGDIENAINRYIVMPGQATAYMIGKIKIHELREAARAEMGDSFDIKGFHDEVLRHGPVPLNVLETNIKKWVAANKAS